MKLSVTKFLNFCRELKVLNRLKYTLNIFEIEYKKRFTPPSLKLARKHVDIIVAFLLLFSMGFSQLFNIIPLFAASYSITWDSQSDFQNNTAGGVATSTVVTPNIDLTTTPGMAALNSASLGGTLTENFAGTYHLDTASTTAVVSSNVLQHTNRDSFTNLSSYTQAKYLADGNGLNPNSDGQSNSPNMAYDESRGLLFFGTSQHLYQVNISTGVSTILDSSFYNQDHELGGLIVHIIDPTSGYIFLKSNYGLWSYDYVHATAPKLLVRGYGTASNNPLFGTVYSGYMFDGLAYSTTTSLLYVGNVNSPYQVVSYNPVTYATSTVSASRRVFGSNNTFINEWRYSPSDNTVWYMDSQVNTDFAKLNLTTGVETVYATGPNYWQWYSTHEYPLVVGDPNSKIIMTGDSGSYSGGATSNGYNFMFNYDSTGGTNIANTINTLFATGTSMQDVVFDTISTNFYIVGCTNHTPSIAAGVYQCGLNATELGHEAKYGPNTNAVWTDLTSAYNTATGTTSPVSRVYTLPSGKELWIGVYGASAISTPAPATQTAQSTTLVTVAGGIQSATLTKSDSVGAGTLVYQLSSDDGVTWNTVTPGSAFTFPSATGTKLKWKVTVTGNATVSSISVAYNNTNYTGTVKNLKKDAGGDAQWVNIFWNATIPANTQVKFRTRGVTSTSGSDVLFAASWSDYYIATSTGIGGTPIKANGVAGATLPTYRYFEVEATLVSSNGVATPFIDSVGVSYAINAPPQFDPNYPVASQGGANALQIATSTDTNWGKVKIDYSVRDPDTDAGTNSPGFITPSFEYRLNSGDSWHAIGSSFLAVNDTAQKSVAKVAYSTYSAYWNAQSQIPSQYSATAQVRVTVNDNELIYNTTAAISPPITLDTTAPVVTLKKIDGTSSTSTVAVNVTDTTTIFDYKMSNNADLSSDGLNGSSGSSITVNSPTLSLATNWNLTGSTTKSVSIVLRDIYGNTATSTIIAPITPPNFEIHDISNVQANLYNLFVAWTPYSSQTGATFNNYELWRSNDGTNYSLYQNITNQSLNYYLDGSVASTTTYYYKIRTLDTDGDSSAFTPVASTQPNGQGGSSLPPVISTVSVNNVKNTSAKILWNSNVLANSTVNYGVTTGYGSTKAVPSYVTAHEVYLTNLVPNTTYHFKVTSTNFYGYDARDDNAGASYTFTTAGGPVITNVTTNSITDTSATIFWNTSTSSDSYVSYSTHADLSSPTLAGNGTLVSSTTSSGVYSHQVQLTGLSVATNYYFFVSSTDSLLNQTVANNEGNFFGFLTTKDVTPPIISNISVPVITKKSAVVVWSTDKEATGQVEWGPVGSLLSGHYPNISLLDSVLSPTHVMTLDALTTKTTYFFRVKSSDAAGNNAVSDEQTFNTADTDAAIVVVRRNDDPVVSPTAVVRNTIPPAIKNITINPINSFGATITVTGNPAFIALVKYAEVSSTTPSTVYDKFSAGDESYDTTKSIVLSALTPGSTYHFIVSLIDLDGNIRKSDEQTFTTKFLAEDLGSLSALDKTTNLIGKIQDILESALPSISPPFIDTPKVASTTESSVLISWNTNIKTFSALDYSSDKDYIPGKYITEVSDLNAATTNHSISLTGLTPGTLYHASAHAFVFPQLVGKSGDFTFTTKTGAITAQILDITTDTFRVVWNTDSPSTSIIDYTNRKTGKTYTQKDSTYSSKHDISAQNLITGNTYDVKAYGYDKNENLISMAGALPVTLAVDIVPPNVTSLRIDSNLVPGRSDIIQSLVSWKTDKPSNSVVTYEEGSGAADQPLKNKVQNDTGFVKDHVVILPSLKPSTIYRIQVSSTDQAGNTLALPIRTIVTPQQTESIVDIIFKNFSDTFNFIGK
jgi:hypothetical protein